MLNQDDPFPHAIVTAAIQPGTRDCMQETRRHLLGASVLELNKGLSYSILLRPAYTESHAKYVSLCSCYTLLRPAYTESNAKYVSLCSCYILLRPAFTESHAKYVSLYTNSYDERQA